MFTQCLLLLLLHKCESSGLIVNTIPKYHFPISLSKYVYIKSYWQSKLQASSHAIHPKSNSGVAPAHIWFDATLITVELKLVAYTKTELLRSDVQDI